MMRIKRLPFDIDFSRLSEAEFASVKGRGRWNSTLISTGHEAHAFQLPSVKFKELAGLPSRLVSLGQKHSGHRKPEQS